jgi:hypothetical protein
VPLMPDYYFVINDGFRPLERMAVSHRNNVFCSAIMRTPVPRLIEIELREQLIGCVECYNSLVVPIYLMARYSNAELRKFRDTSRCSACVHYSGCQLWLALLLMNNELAAPGLDLIVPDITKACPMFFPWTAESARRASTDSGGPPPPR